jgi:hypothetical protein
MASAPWCGSRSEACTTAAAPPGPPLQIVVVVASAAPCCGGSFIELTRFVELIREREHLALPFSLVRRSGHAAQLNGLHFPNAFFGHGGSPGGRSNQCSAPRRGWHRPFPRAPGAALQRFSICAGATIALAERGGAAMTQINATAPPDLSVFRNGDRRRGRHPRHRPAHDLALGRARGRADGGAVAATAGGTMRSRGRLLAPCRGGAAEDPGRSRGEEVQRCWAAARHLPVRL